MTVHELMGWTRCGRCKTKHWNSDDAWNSEYPIDYQPTVLDIIYHLQRNYPYVYVRKWRYPQTVWAAWVARTQKTEEWDEIDIIAEAVADDEMTALVTLLKNLNELEQK